ncbi:cytochrome P450 [Melanogaster broomeanus]|nr:cytochrome P450 [Melanogaster broomeanus]
MDVISAAVYCAGFSLCLTVIVKAWRKHALRKGLPLPPGPKGLPFIGNVFDLDIAEPWLSYEQWGKKYGDIIYSNLFGQDFVVINSVKLAHELVDQRAAIYSDRAPIPTTELFGMGFSTGLLPSGNKWRLHRQLFNIALSKQVIPQYRTMLMEKTHLLLENMLNTPKDYHMHVKTLSSSVIMSVTYGYEVSPKNDPFVTKMEKFLDLFKTVLTPERTALFGAFPFLAHIPSWLPGGRYKQRAVECRSVAFDILNDPINYVKKQMASGTARKSLVGDLFEKGDVKADEENVGAMAATAFIAGAETVSSKFLARHLIHDRPFQTDSTILLFLLALVLDPNIQTKAQEEIDRVVGSERLPDFDDRPNMPYVEAIYLESLRWRPVLPLGVPHMTSTSDVYEGMYIPKGAMVITNLWAMGHDETHFPDSMAFKPERHLTSTGSLANNNTGFAFGFGRRICPGKYLVEYSVWAAIVSVLATLHVAKAKNEFGEEIDVKAEFTTGVTSAPLPFACSITPRSPSAERLIRERIRDE